MKKVSMLILALVVALGALGVGYAAWTDEVTINGTVKTGSVDLVVENWSNTFVWKVPDSTYPGEIYIAHTWENDPLNDKAPAGAITSNTWIDPVTGNVETWHYELAAADSDSNGDDKVSINFYNLFPLPGDEVFRADFLMHYKGTIPVKVQLVDLGYSDDAVGAALAPYIKVRWFESDEDGNYGNEITTPIMGQQWHYCKYVICAIDVDLPQDNTLMLQYGTINGKIQVIQWNEYQAAP